MRPIIASFLLVLITSPCVRAQAPLPCGDCNGDGRVSALDSLEAARHAAVVNTLGGVALIRCNVFGVAGGPAQSGAVVDMLDALQIARASVGLLAPLSCGGPFSLDVGASYTFGGQSLLRSLALGDADNDGDLDIGTHTGRVDIHVAVNDGTGRLASAVTSFVGLGGFYQFEDMTFWDWDRDGILDLVSNRNYRQDIAVFQGDGLLKYTIAHSYPAGIGGTGTRVVTLDLNGDQINDLVSGAGFVGSTAILSAGSPVGGWIQSAPFGRDFQSPIAIGDFDNDGIVDVACGGASGIQFLTDWRSSTLATHAELIYAWGGIAATAIDVDGDGNLDLALCNWYENTLDLITRFGASLSDVSLQRDSLPHNPTCIASGDLDSDGDWDLVVGYHSSSPICCNQVLGVFLGDGAGGLQYSEHTLPFGDSYIGVSLADMDGDGDLDVVMRGYYLTIVKNLLIP